MLLHKYDVRGEGDQRGIIPPEMGCKKVIAGALAYEQSALAAQCEAGFLQKD